MMAITVILAAVIDTLMLGLGNQVSNNDPQASFSFVEGSGPGSAVNINPGDDDSSSTINITHDGGNQLSANNINISEDGTSKALTHAGTPDAFSDGDTISAGKKIVVDAAAGDSIRVIFNNPSSDKTAVIGSFNT